jgi:hypothetical protein
MSTNSNYVKLATDTGDQYLASIAEMQESFLKASAAFTLPTMDMSAAMAAFPTAQEVTEASFAFAQKLLKQQKTFTDQMFAAITPDSKASKK